MRREKKGVIFLHSAGTSSGSRAAGDGPMRRPDGRVSDGNNDVSGVEYHVHGMDESRGY